MSLITLHEVSVSFGGSPVLDSVSVNIEAGERSCVTGRNGEGKSTLLKIIAGIVTPDSGEIIRSSGLRTAYLSQDVPSDVPGTVADIVNREAGDDHGNVRPTAARYLSQLGIDPSVQFNSLSGGMRRRVRLAAAIASEPDILLLDEPTNHLDIESIEWLESFLQRANCTCLFVTHDRAFLLRTAKRVLDLDRGRLAGWDCDYPTFLKRKAALLDEEAVYWERKGKKLAVEEEWIRRGVRARRTRNEGRVVALEELRGEFSRRRAEMGTSRLQIASPEASGRKVVEIKNASFTYPAAEKPVIKDFSALIMRGERIGILGRNGTGKTTLLRLLTGYLKPDKGSVEIGSRVRISVFDQIDKTLRPDESVLANLAEGKEELVVNGTRKHVYGYLQDFLFTPDRARTPVSAISGGERARLLLAKLFLDPGNLLVMDEPTNDLDIETLELLEEQLLEYKGTLILVSHDRQFIDNVVTSSFVLEGDGSVGFSPGGYADWARQRAYAQQEQAPLKKEKTTQPVSTQIQTGPARLGYMEKREHAALPEKIKALEKEVSDINQTLSQGTIFVEDPAAAKSSTERLQAAQMDLECLLERWMELEERAHIK